MTPTPKPPNPIGEAIVTLLGLVFIVWGLFELIKHAKGHH